MSKKKITDQILDIRAGLIEMYKAGFLDAWKPKNEKEHNEMNKSYRKAFLKRFESKITAELKKHEQKKKE